MEIERRNKANRNKIWMHTINTKGATTTTTITNSLLLFLNRAFVTCLCYCFFFVSPVHSLCTGMNVLALKWLHSAVVRRLSLYFFSYFRVTHSVFGRSQNATMHWRCFFVWCDCVFFRCVLFRCALRLLSSTADASFQYFFFCYFIPSFEVRVISFLIIFFVS